MCVLLLSILIISAIVVLNFRNVPTVWYVFAFCFYFIEINNNNPEDIRTITGLVFLWYV